MKRYAINIRDLHPDEVTEILRALYTEEFSFTLLNFDNVIIVVTDKDLIDILQFALPCDLGDFLDINEIEK